MPVDLEGSRVYLFTKEKYKMVKLTLGLLPLGHPHHPWRGHVRRLRSHRPKDLRVHEGEEKAVGIFLRRPQQRVQQEGRGEL